MSTQVCKKCSTEKPLDAFYVTENKYRRKTCIECMKWVAVSWQADNPTSMTDQCPGCGDSKAKRSKTCRKCMPRKLPSLDWRADRHRYLRRWEDGAFVYQHRKVMEETLGRPLLKGENVHHKNGVRSDNRPNNLELWVSIQPAGQRPEDLLEFAEEILRRYKTAPAVQGRT